MARDRNGVFDILPSLHFFLSLDLFLFYIYETFFFQRRSRHFTERDLVGNRRTLWKSSGMQGPPLVQGTGIGDISGPMPTGASDHIFTFICTELGEDPLL